jgi:hypothetical protein
MCLPCLFAPANRSRDQCLCFSLTLSQALSRLGELAGKAAWEVGEWEWEFNDPPGIPVSIEVRASAMFHVVSTGPPTLALVSLSYPQK